MSEALTAKIHTNKRRTLTVMSDLLEKEFGVTTSAPSACLLTQVLYSISSVTGLAVDLLAEVVEARIKRKVEKRGHTLRELIRVLSKPFQDKHNVTYTLSLATHRYNVEQTLEEIIEGRPIIMILDSNAQHAMLHEAINYQDGEVHETAIRAPDGKNFFHCFLGMGYDTTRNGFLILRDNRHTYAFKGYVKLGLPLFERYAHNMTVVGVRVNSVQITKGNRKIVFPDDMQLALDSRHANASMSFVWPNIDASTY